MNKRFDEEMKKAKDAPDCYSLINVQPKDCRENSFDMCKCYTEIHATAGKDCRFSDYLLSSLIEHVCPNHKPELRGEQEERERNPVYAYTKQEGKQCGGEPLEMEGLDNTEELTGVAICMKECDTHDECTGFNSKKVGGCGFFRKGALNPTVKKDHDCYIKPSQKDIEKRAKNQEQTQGNHGKDTHTAVASKLETENSLLTFALISIVVFCALATMFYSSYNTKSDEYQALLLMSLEDEI